MRDSATAMKSPHNFHGGMLVTISEWKKGRILFNMFFVVIRSITIFHCCSIVRICSSEEIGHYFFVVGGRSYCCVNGISMANLC